MISSLHGRILEKDGDSAIIEIGGVGLMVFIPAPTLDRIHPGESISLYTHLVVREDSLTLYGFETKEEREFFELLLGVNGVGPRLANGILSVLNPDTIRRAVIHEQVDVFSRVPGIGKKTAQKILFHLQDRIPSGVEIAAGLQVSDVDEEVLSALTTLGYSVVEAQTALQSVPRETPQDLETRLRLALQYFT